MNTKVEELKSRASTHLVHAHYLPVTDKSGRDLFYLEWDCINREVQLLSTPEEAHDVSE